MQQRNPMTQKKQNIYNSESALETFKRMPTNMVKGAAQSFGDIGAGIGKGMLDAFLSTDYSNENHGEQNKPQEHKVENFHKKGNFNTLYNYEAEQEKRTIKELTQKISQEVQAIKRANSSLAAEVKGIESLTLSSADEKPGIYHIRFLELVLSFLKTIRAKISESSTWLEAMQSKKKKRGSLFAGLSKKKGTQYSMSEELKVTRQTQ